MGGRTLVLVGATRLHGGIVHDLNRSGARVLTTHMGGIEFRADPRTEFVTCDGPWPIEEIDEVFFCNERHLRLAARIAQRAALPAPRQLPVLEHKHVQRRLLGPAGSYASIPPGSSARSVAQALLEFDADVAVKPALLGGGSDGVSRVGADDIRANPTAVARRLLQRHGASTMLIERWREGIEYCVDGRIVGAKPYFLSVGRYVKHPGNAALISGIVFSHFHESDAMKAAGPVIEGAIERLELPDGPFHLELVLGDPEGRDSYVVEVHGRFGGSVVPEAILLATGVNPFLWDPGTDIGISRGSDRKALVYFAYPRRGVSLRSSRRGIVGDSASGYRVHGSVESAERPSEARDRVAHVVAVVDRPDSTLPVVDGMLVDLGLYEALDATDHEHVLHELASILEERE